MSFRVFASAAILEAQMGDDAGFSKSAHRAVFEYTPREGYLYVRSRAISSRCNDNFDMFPAEEIERSYLSFIGKPVFVNHHNEDHRRSRGVVIDAALHKDRNPDGSPDTWAEVLMEVDAMRFPMLAKAILKGEVDRTSMGCDVQLSKCSVCGNEATSPLQYCAHIPGKKGKKIYKLDPRTGEKKTQLVFEICSGLSFFENSLLVEAPADPTAFFLGNVELGPGLDHLTAGLNKTASKIAHYEAMPRPGSVFHKASPTAVNEAFHVHEVASDSGLESGFVPVNTGIHVHDYPTAIRELQNNWDIHDDNVNYGGDDKKRDSNRRREVGKLIKSLQERSPKQASISHYLTTVQPPDREGGNYSVRCRKCGPVVQNPNYNLALAAVEDHLNDHWTGQAKVAAAPVITKPDYDLIGEDEARGNSRAVSEDEFHALAQRGKQQYEELAKHRSGTHGLDSNWDHIKNHGYVQAQHSWGGATYNAETGRPLETDADRYALTARPPGMHGVSVPEHATFHEFATAMDQARHHYGDILGRKDHHLGVFHDDDKGSIDIDPVLVVHHPHEVESIGAYTHAVGGAYHFKSGDGYFPPHVKGLRTHSRLIKRATEPLGEPENYTKEGTVPAQSASKIWSLLHEAAVSGDDLLDWDFVVTAVRPDNKNPGVIDYKGTSPMHTMTDSEKKGHFHEIGRAAYLQARNSGSTSTENYHPDKKVGEMSDDERETHFQKISHVQGIADNWIDKHPVNANNVTSSWKDSSPEHKEQGRHWYSDANEFSHTAAHLINRDREDTGKEPLTHTQVAGLIGVYSPQAEWHANLHVALHAGRTGVAVGGGGEASKIPVSGGNTTGSFTSKSQAHQASDILSGMHYNDALASTSSKVRNFSHLIEHGDSDTHVVVDRHASSVAHGARVPDFVFDHGVMPKLATKGGYEKYANAFRSATKTINKSEEEPVQPHMVQAATWLHQQKLNNADGRRGKNASAAFNKLKSYIGETYPHDSEELLRAPGTGHSHDQHSAVRRVAYGETKSPEDVDTLRSENCTVCGNSSAWDGTQCQVCGYVAPPRPFGDPDTDIAQQKDIRKQVLDGTEADPNDPNQQLGQQLGDPEELEDQQDAAAAGEDPQLPTLTCNTCGTGIQPSAPTSDTGGEPAYPAEGDVCPVCKKGELLGEGIEDEEADMDSVDAEEGQEGDAPGGASQQQLEEDDGDEDMDEEYKGKQDSSDDDDEDDGDSFDPKKKADKNQKASSWYPTWFRQPVWFKS